MKKEQEEKKKKESMSIHSQLTSSLMETSEDDSTKKKEAEAAAKKKKQGFSETELEEIINIDLTETKTITLFFIPGTVVNNDTEEEAECIKNNKGYAALKVSKIGSDMFMPRGSQTLNPA